MTRDERQAFVLTLRYPVIVFDRNSDLYCTLKNDEDAQALVKYSSDEADWSILPNDRSVDCLYWKKTFIAEFREFTCEHGFHGPHKLTNKPPNPKCPQCGESATYQTPDGYWWCSQAHYCWKATDSEKEKAS